MLTDRLQFTQSACVIQPSTFWHLVLCTDITSHVMTSIFSCSLNQWRMRRWWCHRARPFRVFLRVCGLHHSRSVSFSVCTQFCYLYVYYDYVCHASSFRRRRQGSRSPDLENRGECSPSAFIQSISLMSLLSAPVWRLCCYWLDSRSQNCCHLSFLKAAIKLSYWRRDCAIRNISANNVHATLTFFSFVWFQYLNILLLASSFSYENYASRREMVGHILFTFLRWDIDFWQRYFL